jgi:hypothetical protein
MPRWITDVKANELALSVGIDRDEATRGLHDAEIVWHYIREHEWIEESDLRAWAETHGIDPDRMNIALSLLERAGRGWPVEVTEPVAALAAGPEEEPGGLHGMGKAELNELAKEQGIETPSKMSKPDLINALESQSASPSG